MLNQPDPRMAASAQSPETVTHGGEHTTVRSATTGGSYAESRRTHYVDPAGNQVVSQVEVYQDKNLGRANRRSWLVNSVSFLLGVLEMVLVLRFFFRLLGASQDNSFLLFLYNLSQVFVAPFHGIFHDQALGTRSVFELSTLIAMLVFALLAWSSRPTRVVASVLRRPGERRVRRRAVLLAGVFADMHGNSTTPGNG